MTTWQSQEFDHTCTVSPGEIVRQITSNPERNICLSFRNFNGSGSPGNEMSSLQRVVQEHKGIIVVLVNGRACGWMTALVLSSDLAFATRKSTFTLEDLDYQALSAVATEVGSRLSKPNAIQFFLDNNHDSLRLKNLGLITGFVNEQETANPVEFLNSFMNVGKESAIIRLKEVWRKARTLDKQDSLTVERLEFSKCFEPGAAESIAAYLQNRFKTNKA